MNQKTLSPWLAAHAVVLFLAFSLLIIPKMSKEGRVSLPFIPEQVLENRTFFYFLENWSNSSFDTFIYYRQAQYLLHGTLDKAYLTYKERNDDVLPNSTPQGIRLPYRDLPFEYPPLALVPILIPALFTTDSYVYRVLFCFLASTAYLATLWILVKIYRDLPRDSFPEEGLSKALGASFIFLLFLGPLTVFRLDIFATFLVTLALRFLQKAKPITSGLFLACAVATKLYPLILFPLFSLFLIQNFSRTNFWKFCLGFLGTLGAMYIPILILAPEGYLHSLAYHGKRGVEVESLWASWAQIKSLWGEPAHLYFKYGSNNIQWSGEEGAKKYWSLFALFAMGLAYLHYLFKSGREKTPSFSLLLESALLILLGLLITSKVLSPQFLIWLFPLFLVVGIQKKWLFPVFFQTTLATQMIYPFLFVSLSVFQPLAVFILAFRNLLLLALFVMLLDWKLILGEGRFYFQKAFVRRLS